MTSRTTRNKVHALRVTAAAYAAPALLCVAQAACADDTGFTGDWMIRIAAPDVVPYAGLLEIEQRGDEWFAWVEHGPAPVNIDGKRIELTIDARDRQGFRFERILEGTLDDGTMSGVMHSVGVLETAAEYGEDGSPWTAVRAGDMPPRRHNHTLDDFAGTWIAVRGVDLRKYTMDLTPSAREWLAGYDARMDEPQKRCVSPGLVAAVTWSFPFEIIASKDRLTMLYEAFGLSRRVFMNVDDMPEFYPPSSMGYSRGKIEDGELVIETTLLSASTREFNGEPVGENARIVERYFLSDGGERLNVIMEQHDPDNYRRPPIRRRTWEKNETAIIFPFECDPDSFFRQLFEEGRMQEYIDRAYRRP